MRGVNSLSLIISQADCVISLSDEVYDKRAWCRLEVLFTKRLRRRGQGLLWFRNEAGALLLPAEDMPDGDPGDLQLSFESDRASLRFFFLQGRLI